MSKQVRVRPLIAYIAALALALIVPALVFSGLVTERWVSSEEARLGMLAREANSDAATQVERYLTGQIAMLQALATSPALETRDFERFDRQARDVLDLQGIHIVLRDRTGQQRINTRLPWGSALPRSEVDADRAVLRTKQPYVSDLFTGVVTKEPLVMVDVPVLRFGEVVYFLNASILPQVIADLMAQTGIAAPYSAFIADRSGRVIARAPHTDEDVGRPLPGFAEEAGPRQAWEEANPQGTVLFASYHRSALSGWYVGVGVQKAALEAPLTRSLGALALMATLLTAIGVALSLLVVRKLLRSQQQLAATVQALQNGEAVEAPVTAILETNRVGEVLSSASVRLLAQTTTLDLQNRELESRVAERTRDLAEHTALLQATLDNMDQGLMMSNAQGTLLICNQRAVDLLGLDPNMMARCPTITELREYQLQHGELARLDETFQQAVLDCGDGNRRQTFEYVRPNGTVLEIRSIVLPEGGAVRTYTDVTARRKAEAIIRESEARYRLLADHATDMIVRADLDTTRTYVSPASRELLGYEPVELVGTRPNDLVHPDDMEALTRPLDDLTGGRADAAACEYRLRHKNGAYVWVEGKFRSVRDEEGQPDGYIATVRDISDRKAAESILRANKARYRQVLDAAHDAYVAMDAAGLITAWNAAAEAAFGWSAEESMGQPLAELIVPERFRDAHTRGFERHLQVGAVPLMGQRLELAALDRNGTELPIEITISKTEVAGALRFHAFIRDITLRKAHDWALIESEARYRLLADNSSDIILVREIGGPRTYVSPACFSVLGYTQQEFLTLPLDDLIHPDDCAHVTAVYEAISQERPQLINLHRLKHKQGHWVWVESVFKLLDGGEEASVLVAIRDVSERQKQSEEIKLAKEVAEHASQAKGDFLAAMSHEIRTPLNGILGYADLLLDDRALNDDQRRYAERIQTAGSALLTIVNDILDFSKIEAGKVDLEPQSVLLSSLIDKTVSIVAGVAARKRLDIRAELDPRAPGRVVVDGDRLRQVLLNLLNNAVKFTPAGAVTLTVRYEGESPTGARLRFEVSDTGIGIPKHKNHRLFKRFSQMDGSIQREFGGTGLGLAICKRLIELMGGEIGVHSEPGQGSTFWFTLTLPCAEKGEPADSPANAVCRGTGLGARILLVEDVEMNQELARAMLEAAGHNVDVVADGADAVMAVQARTYDLVLMDVQMPGMDGITATKHIRELDHAARDLPIVAMTANVLPTQVAQTRQAGMDDHIRKPFKRLDLYAVVERWTSRSRHPAQALGKAITPEAAEDVCDREVFAGILEMMGRERTMALLDKLAHEIEARLGEDGISGADPIRTAQDAHALASAAGMLGFAALSNLCRGLESACESQADLAPLLPRIAPIRSAVLKEIQSLQAA